MANRGYSCKPEKNPEFARIPLNSHEFASRVREKSREIYVNSDDFAWIFELVAPLSKNKIDFFFFYK
jgi:hypothetical protein